VLNFQSFCRILKDIEFGDFMQHPQDQLHINLSGFTFHDLYDPRRLHELTEVFSQEFQESDAELAARFEAYRAKGGEGFNPVDTSQLLVAVAPHVSRFVARIFGVGDRCNEMRLVAERERVIMKFKKEFFLRRVLKKFTPESVSSFDTDLLDRQMRVLLEAFSEIPRGDLELEIASVVIELLEHERFVKTTLPESSLRFAGSLREKLRDSGLFNSLISHGADEPVLRAFLASIMNVVEQWVATEYTRRSGRTKDWVTFKVPHQLDYMRLVEMQTLDTPVPNCHTGRDEYLRRREGFNLTDPRYAPREVRSEVDYCIFCHERNKDSCSKGFFENGAYRKNPLGSELNGCPLDQKISESHLLKNEGDSIGALALIMIDNPMVPGTGHRICNDCMKACIYQKQDPVNIPQIETRILTDVLDLPWGFEIYSLLTRWNPMNVKRPHALPYNGMNILVVGLGPAGYTLSHYFLNEGFGVVGVDGLKIEPLPVELVGDAVTPFAPLRDFSSISKTLSERVLAGFGGVSEYGITVRWDKNFLSVIYLNLMRRKHFRVYDGVRFGGTLPLEDAWEYGFDHVCMATGAGKPTFVTMRNNLIRGIRKASDFLMALQLTGAGKTDSMANLQVQLPAAVIGGGLTAIDTATELMAYYPVQVSKIKKRYDRLVKHYGAQNVDEMFDHEERERLEVFLHHAESIEAERQRAANAGERPNFVPLIRSWGGVHIYYRKSMTDSPAYRLNHEEIIKSLEEGIAFVEKMSPVEAVPDVNGAVQEMVFERMDVIDGKWKSSGQLFRVPAKTVMVAAGTVPNVMYEREHPGTFTLDGWGEFFETFNVKHNGDQALRQVAKDETGFFTSYERNGRYVTFYGDNHPEFAGNVVKAMASAKEGHRAVLGLFGQRLEKVRSTGEGVSIDTWESFTFRLDNELKASVVNVNRLTPTIIEIVVRAPKAAREFHPGQFFRLQNYEVDSLRVEDTLVMMEGIALTGAWVDPGKGLIGLITLEVGASSRMCAILKPGQRIVVMGPTGTPTEIPSNSTILLLGGGLGNAVLFSIAKACKAKNNTVIYFAGYKRRDDFFKREEIESSTDVVVYSVDSGEPIPVKRPQDRTFVGNIIQAMVAYARGELGVMTIPLTEAHRIIAIGSDRMMAAVTRARHDVLQPYLSDAHAGIVSINSPMQCMMKAICAQCLQRHVDPETGNEVFVFSCVNQDQPMDHVDFANLNARLRTNSVMEKITNKWLDYILETHPMETV
jgi:NADPH-dependent glutamate synthase beta subunit-like oxidoreductase/NAD(P)H-flavin reductase